MATSVNESANAKAISASTLVRTGSGIMLGIFCSSAGGTSRVHVSDATASAASAAVGRIVAPFAPTAGTFHRIPVGYTTGLYVSLTGSAATVTVCHLPQAN